MTARTRSRAAAAAAPPAGRRYGSETPRVFTPPLRKLTPRTSLGFEVIAFAEDVIGIELLPWQKWLLIHALELLPDGTFRFRTVVVLVARQNGKSTLLQIIALWRMYVDMAKLIIGTAQNLDIAEEVWQGAVDIAQDVPELEAEIERVVQVNGKKALELSFGSRYKVQAANRRGGRGLSGDLVALDELREHQTWDAWGAVTKTTLARPRAQVWALSNAGDSSSIVLRYLRRMAHLALGDPDGLWTEAEKEALAGRAPLEDVLGDELTAEVEATLADFEDDDSLGIFEWSAPPGCDVWDRDGWAQANPSLGYTITERAIASAARTDPEAVFRTEVLCQWVDGMAEQVIPEKVWRERRDVDDDGLACDPPTPIGEPVMPAIDVAPGHSTAAVAVAGRRADGKAQVEIVDHRPGTTWLIDRLIEVCERNGLPREVAMLRGPGGAMVPELTRAGFEVHYLAGEKATAACGGFYKDVLEGDLVHLDQAPLNDAVAGAARRIAGDAWLWVRKDSSSDIAPLCAVTAARHVMVGIEPDEDYDVLDSGY